MPRKIKKWTQSHVNYLPAFFFYYQGLYIIFLPQWKEKKRRVKEKKKRIAQIARKLPSEMKPRTVNCLWGILLLLLWVKNFFHSGEKTLFFLSCHGAKKCFQPARKKSLFPLSPKLKATSISASYQSRR